MWAAGIDSMPPTNLAAAEKPDPAPPTVENIRFHRMVARTYSKRALKALRVRRKQNTNNKQHRVRCFFAHHSNSGADYCATGDTTQHSVTNRKLDLATMRVAAAVRAGHTLEECCRVLLQQLLKLTDAQYGCLSMIDHEREEVWTAFWVGDVPRGFLLPRRKVDNSSLAGRMMTHTVEHDEWVLVEKWGKDVALAVPLVGTDGSILAVCEVVRHSQVGVEMNPYTMRDERNVHQFGTTVSHPLLLLLRWLSCVWR